MEDAIVQFATTGKLNFKSLTASILAEAAKVMANKAVAGLLGWAMNAAASFFTPSNANTTIPMQPGGGYAKGGVFSGSSLHQYANTVQTAPKFFAFDTLHGFAKGGVFAEAGPEAVMPLARGADGKLGVKAQGATGDVNISIVVNENGTASQKASGADTRDAWAQFAGRIKSMILDEMTTQKRPGGLLYG